MSNKKYRPRHVFIRIPLLLAVLCLPSMSQAALNAYLDLSCGGSDIDGDSPVDVIGGLDVSNMIEVTAFGLNLSLSGDRGSGRVSARRSYKPVRIIKRIDQSSPLLVQALVQNQSCDAILYFFRPSPTGDGTTEQFYTVTLEAARIVAITPTLASTLDPATVGLPLTEAVSFAINTIRFTYEPGGVEFEDDVTSSAS